MANQVVAVRFVGGTQHIHIAGAIIVRTGARPVEAAAYPVKTIVTNIQRGIIYIVREVDGSFSDVSVVTEGERIFMRARRGENYVDSLLQLPRYDLDETE